MRFIERKYRYMCSIAHVRGTSTPSMERME